MDFNALLRPFDEIYTNMYRSVRNELLLKSDDELKELQKAFGKVTKTNCSWTAYEVAPIVKREIKYILQERNN